MNITTKTAALTASLALMAAPAIAKPPSGNPGKGMGKSGSAQKLAAPGQFCKGVSKKRVAGQKGTPFSRCVKARAKLRSEAATPDEAAPTDDSPTTEQETT
jgi:hypothetical protein